LIFAVAKVIEFEELIFGLFKEFLT